MTNTAKADAAKRYETAVAKLHRLGTMPRTAYSTRTLVRAYRELRAAKEALALA